MAKKNGTGPENDALVTAKIHAAMQIIEWSKDSIEPGVSGTPSQKHIALAEAFTSVYSALSQAIGVSEGPVDASHGDNAMGYQAIARSRAPSEVPVPTNQADAPPQTDALSEENSSSDPS